ncbi:uncharacterized protein LOC120211945 [Hibiscus syriacus]|uniref:uncharacterized protein LOC120211945 n=1 Tax=Hibiscus syriacus TaxID=106335 RepID=UPI001923FCC9|nr:uncharacterized protein LOC120211945 [Hibiscus syriacus]
MEIEIAHISNQFINGIFRPKEVNTWAQFIAIYANPNGSKRKHLWSQLEALAPNDNTPWIMGGDLNVILDVDERRGGATTHTNGSRLFANFMHSTGLLDLGFHGPPFTWNRGNLQQRLDRCLGNTKWISTFPNSQVLHLDRIGSDHRPLLLRLTTDKQDHKNRPFRCIAAWQEHHEFKDFIKSIWKENGELNENISTFKTEVKKWNSYVFGHIGKKEKNLIGTTERNRQSSTTDTLRISGRVG